MVLSELCCINEHPRVVLLWNHQISPRRKPSKHLLHFWCSIHQGERAAGHQQDAHCWMALVYTQCFELTCWGSMSGASPGSTAFFSWYLEWEIERFWQILRGLLLLLKIFSQDVFLNLFCNFWDTSMTWGWTGLPLISSVWDLGSCHSSIAFSVVGASLLSHIPFF